MGAIPRVTRVVPGSTLEARPRSRDPADPPIRSGRIREVAGDVQSFRRLTVDAWELVP